MSDRTYVTTLLFGCAIVLIGLIWVVGTISDAPRSSHGSGIDPVATRQILELSDQVSALSDKLGNFSGTGAGGAAPTRRSLDLPAGQIPVRFTTATLPVDDPLAPEWDEATAVTLNMERQDQTMPVLDVVTVPEITVRALTDGLRIAWCLSWPDDEADFFLDTDLFCDAVAIQFPLKPNAAYTMGAIDFPVQIIQWKAIWQKDIDEHFQDVQDLHPNYWADLYWFADGEFPYPVPDAFSRTESHDWFVAYRAGNPMADIYRSVAAQEMISEGYGTLTHQPDSALIARGVWQDGRWHVVFARPMQTNDPADYQFTPGGRNTVAFAIWQGGDENVGGKHQQTQWVVFEVQ
jgi:hypothetical protein